MNYLQTEKGIKLMNIICYFQFKTAAINSAFATTWTINPQSTDTRDQRSDVQFQLIITGIALQESLSTASRTPISYRIVLFSGNAAAQS